MRNNFNWTWFLFKTVTAIVATVGTVSFFWAPLEAAIGWLANSLAENPVWANLPIVAAAGWGAITLLALIVLAMIFRTRNRPVTILTSKFINRFCDSNGNRVCCQRRQIFRANRPDVTSYPIGTWPNFGGSTARESIVIQEDGVRCEDDLVTGTPGSGWEIVHRFKDGLNFSIIFALTPTWLLRKLCIETQNELPTVMRGAKYLRTLDVEYELIDEYNDVELPTLRLQNPNQIRQRDIWFLVEFEDYPVDPDSVRAHIITDRRVEDVQRKSASHENRKFTFHVPTLVQNTIRISWRRGA